METTMKVINLDEIRPKQYESNIERYGEDGCIICGRPLSERDMENGKFVHMLPNGDITDSQELDGKIPDNPPGISLTNQGGETLHIKPKTMKIETIEIAELALRTI